MKCNFFLIGNPVGHSFSADYFNSKFRKEGIDARYDLCQLNSIEDLPDLIKHYGDFLRGFNVTAPFKKEVIKYLDRLTPEAEQAGAVNCVRREPDGSLTGHNTDVYGFLTLLINNLPDGAEPKNALVIGGGGVVGAVTTALESKGINTVFAVRNPEKFKADYPDLTSEIVRLEDLSKDDILKADLIINCTPLGTFPDVRQSPRIPYEYIQPRHVCLDLVYNPEETTFSRICAAHGAKAATGLAMLISQAEEGWRFWNREM